MRLQRFRGAAVLLMILAFGLGLVAAGYAAAKKGDKAPGFKLTSLDGKTLTLDQIRKGKKVVVLDFWATWCPPCRLEAPALQKLHEKYGAKGVAIVGVALDEGGAADVKPFAKKNKLTYTLVTDPEGSASRKYGVRGIPHTVILDRNGVIKFSHVGFYAGMEKQMESEIQSLLK